MVFTKALSDRVALLAAACVWLGGCLGMPDSSVMFRDLADIPGRPDVASREANDRAVQALEDDRARTAQAIEGLRNEPFAPPEPAPVRPDP